MKAYHCHACEDTSHHWTVGLSTQDWRRILVMPCGVPRDYVGLVNDMELRRCAVSPKMMKCEVPRHVLSS